MKQKLIPIMDKILLRKQSLIETVNDQLKNLNFALIARILIVSLDAKGE